LESDLFFLEDFSLECFRYSAEFIFSVIIKIYAKIFRHNNYIILLIVLHTDTHIPTAANCNFWRYTFLI
jgi:hypothetical protein